MRAFKFRLERILKYRHSLVLDERVTFSRKAGELARAQEHESELRNLREAMKVLRIHALSEGTTSTEVGNIHNHLLRIGDAIDSAAETVVNAEKDVEEARGELVEKMRDERAIELLKERRWKAWQKEYYRDEGRVLDDIANIRHARIDDK